MLSTLCYAEAIPYETSIHKTACNYLQDKAPKKKQRKQRPAPTWLRFENINKIAYFQDNEALKAIAVAEEKKDLIRLKGLLANYITQFGIENFAHDTKLIWKLAKLTELLDGLEVARPIYQLVLRHHHEDIALGEIEPYYKQLNEEHINAYVPLDYYYELVQHQLYIDTLYAPRSQLLNLGNLINSKKADYAPFLDKNNELLFLSSKRETVVRRQKLAPNEDIYLSTNDAGSWTKSKPLLEINTKEFNEGSVCLSADGQKLYFARCNAPDGLGDCDLFVAYRLVDNSWGHITPLGAAVNSAAWDSHPALSPGGDTLYFASDRAGGFGLSDIYYTTQNEHGEWQPAQNIGPIINTRNNEVSPFVANRRGRVLYFSSNGQLYNFGGFDIYRSNWAGDYWDNPVNIGPLVNGTGSEHYFNINNNFTQIYYAKSLNNDLNGQDLYAFPLPMEAHPEARTLLEGRLLNEETNEPLQGIVAVIDLDQGIEIAPRYLSKDGRFSFQLINNRNYLLVIQGDNFLRIEELFYLSGDTEIERTATPVSRKITFQSIEFETGKADLTDDMKRDLRKLTDFLSVQTNYMVEISGHTDAVGDADKNMVLSKQRAKNIQNHILETGSIEAERVRSEGYGSTRPIVKEHTDADRALNRRVEFHIYDPVAAQNTNDYTIEEPLLPEEDNDDPIGIDSDWEAEDD